MDEGSDRQAKGDESWATVTTPGHSAAAAALSLSLPLTPRKSALSVARVSPGIERQTTGLSDAGSDIHRTAAMSGSQELENALHGRDGVGEASSHKGAPSISIDLSEFPPALEPRSVQPDEQSGGGGGGGGAHPRPAAPDFLTQRLRSAIGQELLVEESGVAAAEEGQATAEPGERPTVVKRPSQAGSLSQAAEKGWRWSTFTTVPSALKFENALQGLSFSGRQQEEGTNGEGKGQDGRDVATDGTTSMTSYMAALDVRRWFAMGDGEAEASGSKVPKAPAPRSPIKGMQPGSFPAAPRSKRSKGERKGTASSDAAETAASASTDSNPTALPTTTTTTVVPATQDKTGRSSNVIEHDLTERVFGVSAGEERYPSHEYLIMSTAGKPIFWSKASKARLERERLRKRRKRQQIDVEHDRTAREVMEKAEDELVKQEQELQDEEDQTEATRVGLLQAVISNFAESDRDKLHATAKEVLGLPATGKVAFLLRPPLYLVAVARWNDAESTLRNHLDHLYQAIISLVSATKLNRLFDRAANFDLRRLLQGTDNILDSLLNRLQNETIAMRGALQPLRLDAALRHDAGAALMPSRNRQQRPQDALYALLLTRRGIVTIARRRKNGIHPIDCHLLINTVLATKALKEGGTQSWVPICLPKFAPQGFVYAHVSFLDGESASKEESTAAMQDRRPDLGLVLITGNPDGFDEMSGWRDRILHQFREVHVLDPLLRIARDAAHDGQQNRAFGSYSADELGLPGLRHFCFKWRSNMQSTSSAFESPYLAGTDEHKRLLCLYGAAHELVVRSAKENGAGGAATDSAGQSEDAANETDASSLASTIADRRRRPKDVGKGPSAAIRSRSSSPPILPRSVLATPSGSSTGATSKGIVGALRDKLPLTAASSSSTHILKTASETVLAWSTTNFELYLSASPHASRKALLALAKGVVKWVKQEEHRLFIVSAPIF